MQQIKYTNYLTLDNLTVSCHRIINVFEAVQDKPKHTEKKSITVRCDTMH